MTTVDKIEIEKFSKMAEDWWNPNGKFKPLHQLNPARVKFIRDKLISHFNLNPNNDKPLRSLKILDIGCGGGLLCEPLCRMGATVTGIDPSSKNIGVAKLHSKEMNLDINYIHCSPEQLEFKNEFDVSKDIIDELDKNLGDSFNLFKLDKIFQVILKSATYEILYKPNVSIRIIIKPL